jgi:hypothetical protein
MAFLLRSRTCSYIGRPDLPGRAYVLTFAIDGTHLNTFAHYLSGYGSKREYYQCPISAVNLLISYDDFKKGRQQLKNLQDLAKEHAEQLRDAVKRRLSREPSDEEASDDLNPISEVYVQIPSAETHNAPITPSRSDNV